MTYTVNGTQAAAGIVNGCSALGQGAMYMQGGPGGGAPAPPTASELGYTKRIPPQKALFNSHGQSVYSNGKNYITKDIDAHRGGVWKMFDRGGNRIGTYNGDLSERVGD